jgi:site-specific DNA-methyltransferase (adenine-specific)
MIEIYRGDNLPILKTFDACSFDLIYIDPPFNTNKTQSKTRLKTTKAVNGDRTGFSGNRYKTEKLSERSYEDRFDDYIEFLRPRLMQAHRILKQTGSLFFHIDYREAHYCKILLDEIFGRESFINEIIWAYDYGGRSKSKWPPKHDNIFWYAKNPKNYTFNYDEIDRIPYMAPELVGPEKAARGKTPTDVWWHTIVSPGSKEQTGYPTQKPLGVVTRIVKVHSNPGDRLLDFFAGSGTFGEAAEKFGRDCVLVDSNPEAVKIMFERLAFASPSCKDLEPNRAAAASNAYHLEPGLKV